MTTAAGPSRANQVRREVNTRTAHSRDRDSRVLGFFAYAGPDEVFRFDEACLIAGSQERLQACLATHPKLRDASLTLAKIRFSDVRAGLDEGAAYALDEEAFERFANPKCFHPRRKAFERFDPAFPVLRLRRAPSPAPPATAGIDVAETFPDAEPDTLRFVKVALADAERSGTP